MQERYCSIEGKSNYPIFQFGDRKFYKCPILEINPNLFQYLNLYLHYRNGYLLTTGGIIDQPYHYVQAMEIIHSEILKIENEKIEKEKKQIERQKQQIQFRMPRKGFRK